MRVQLRIVSGSLKGRKIQGDVHPGLRPTPEMVREALFSILGNAIPHRPFVDLFAGTGVIGLEALSRGASEATFIDRDPRLLRNIENNLKEFGLREVGRTIRTDAYRWADAWQTPADPINVYVSPPFPDLDSKAEEFVRFIEILQQKLAVGSVLVIQSEKGKLVDTLPNLEQWDLRQYGRNLLLIWVKEAPIPPVAASM